MEQPKKQKKYIVICGSGISGIGKGITVSSIALLLKQAGVRIAVLKIDPYLNIDAGLMNPYEHGEVFVLDDGGEVDLDLGNYERFLDFTFTRDHNITSGKIYDSVIKKEREGSYLGRTVQVVPHVTNEIKSRIMKVGTINLELGSESQEPDVVLIEIGGTIGDLESGAYYESIRQMIFENGPENFIIMYLSLVPTIKSSGEMKTKPTQNGAKEIRYLGLTPDFLVVRSEQAIDDETKKKLSLFCSIKLENIINVPDVKNTLEVPFLLEAQNITTLIMRSLQIPHKTPKLAGLSKYLEKMQSLREPGVLKKKIIIVGKYIKNLDSYLSLEKAVQHASVQTETAVEIKYVDSIFLDDYDYEAREGNAEAKQLWELLESADGVIVAGGFGSRGTLGKIRVIKFLRERDIPFLGICLGFQLACIEFARNVLNLPKATSQEIEENPEVPLIIETPENIKGLMGGTLRLGARKAELAPGSLASIFYRSDVIFERHRHRYEFNPAYIEMFEKNGMMFTGRNVDERGQNIPRMEILELNDKRFFVGTQFHPEFKSRLLRASPLFVAFLYATSGKEKFEGIKKETQNLPRNVKIVTKFEELNEK